MFSSFMMNAWYAATIVAVVSGTIGFFVVARGSSFVAHAVPQSAFAGAAGASLIGVSTIGGLGVFSVGAAVLIGVLGRRGRHDVVTALAVTLMLGLGALFLSWSDAYAPEVYSLLFGEVLGVSSGDVGTTLILGLVSVALLAALYRPLLLTSVVPDVAEARGVPGWRMEIAFLLVVAVATTATVPVVGALLTFSLMVGPPAAARCLTARPLVAVGASAVIALVVAWASIAAAYRSNWPVGFYVGVLSAAVYVIARVGTAIAGRTRRNNPAVIPA